MSRLNSFIRRLEAQRDLLDASKPTIKPIHGAIAELGLGNGRTYDHLRTLYPDRKIIVFEKDVRAHTSCTPTQDCLVLGDFRQTLPDNISRFGGQMSLIHADIGSGNTDKDVELLTEIAPILETYLAPLGLLMSDQPLPEARLPGTLKPFSLIKTLPQNRYFVYQKASP